MRTYMILNSFNHLPQSWKHEDFCAALRAFYAFHSGLTIALSVTIFVEFLSVIYVNLHNRHLFELVVN